MTFPDGRIKDGIFDNNIFKGNVQVVEGSEMDKTLQQDDKNQSFVKQNTNTEGQRQSVNREQKEIRIKTRGGSNSIHR